MATALTMIVWLAAAALGVLLDRAGQMQRRRESATIRLARVLLLAWSAVVLTAFAANAIGSLTPSLIVAGPVGVAAIVLASLANIHLPRGARRRQPAALPGTDPVPLWPLALGGVAAALAISLIIYRGLLAFPRDWDSLAYHIPLVDHWLRAGRLYVPACAFWYVPGNNELVGLWLVAPFSGDYLIALNNVPAALLLAVSQFSFLGEFTRWRPLTYLGTCGVLATQPVLRQLISAENDMAVAALFAAALLFGLRFVKHGGRWDAACSAIAIGLLAGVKYYALGYAAAAGAALICGAAARHGPRSATGFAALCIVAFLALASYWYLRNWHHTGTFLFPKGVLGGPDLWSEMRPQSARSSLIGSGRPVVWPLYFQAMLNQAGPLGTAYLVAAIAWPCFAIGGFVTRLLRHLAGTQSRAEARSGRRRDVKKLVLAGCAALSLAVLVSTPNLVETTPDTMNMLRGEYLPARFSLCVLCLGAACGVAIAQESGRLFRTLVVGRRGQPIGRTRLSAAPATRRNWLGSVTYTVLFLLGGWQVINQLWRRIDWDWLILAYNVFGLLSLLYCLSCYRGRSAAWIRAMGCIGLAIGASAGSQAIADRWHRDFAAHYSRMFRFLPQLPADAGHVTVCDYRYYPWLGDRRQHSVSRPLWLPQYEQLIAHLSEFKASLIVALDDDPFPQGRYENVAAWIREHPQKFTVISEDGNHIVASVRADAAATGTGAAP